MTKTPTSSRIESAIVRAGWSAGSPPVDEIRKLVQKYDALLKQLRNAAEAGNDKKRHYLINVIAQSPASAWSAVIRGLEHDEKRPWAEVVAAVASFNPYADCGEPVHVFYKEKKSGKFRACVAYGLKRRAGHIFLVDLLSAIWGVAQCDYCCEGLGANAAATHIEKLANDHAYGVIFDAENFYGSVNTGTLPAYLGLPKKMIENMALLSETVQITHGTIPTNHTIDSLIGAARCGIPQGSRASSAIASRILGPVLAKLASKPEDAIAYVDDGFVAVKSKAEGDTFVNALRECLGTHMLGPFHLRFSDVVKLHDPKGFEILNYYTRYDGGDGCFHYRPRKQAFKRADEERKKLAATLTALAYTSACRRYFRAFRKAYPLWKVNTAVIHIWMTTSMIIWSEAHPVQKPKTATG
jgi:hypothetical protein